MHEVKISFTTATFKTLWNPKRSSLYYQLCWLTPGLWGEKSPGRYSTSAGPFSSADLLLCAPTANDCHLSKPLYLGFLRQKDLRVARVSVCSSIWKGLLLPSVAAHPSQRLASIRVLQHCLCPLLCRKIYGFFNQSPKSKKKSQESSLILEKKK